jgi:hypothetical protein
LYGAPVLNVPELLNVRATNSCQAFYSEFRDNARSQLSPWTAWIILAPRLVSDRLALLGMRGRLYLDILESKQGRECWIRQLSLNKGPSQRIARKRGRNIECIAV